MNDSVCPPPKSVSGSEKAG